MADAPDPLHAARDALHKILLETRRKISALDRLSAVAVLARRALEATNRTDNGSDHAQHP